MSNIHTVLSKIHSCVSCCTHTRVISTHAVEYSLLISDASIHSIYGVIVDLTFYSIFQVKLTRLFFCHGVHDFVAREVGLPKGEINIDRLYYNKNGKSRL